MRLLSQILAPRGQRPRRDGHVAMFHHDRCGSSLLGDLRDPHSDVCGDGEIFKFKRSFWKEGTSAGRSNPLGVLERHLRPARKPTYSCEIKCYHAQQIGFSL